MTCQMLHGGQQLIRTPWWTAGQLSYLIRSVEEAALAPVPLTVAVDADICFCRPGGLQSSLLALQ